MAEFFAMGGYGFSEEYGIIHCYEAARLLRTAPITAEMILNFVAEHGDDMPDGTAIFQIWFVPGANSVGGLADSEIPAPFGPRNCGQFSPVAAAEENKAESAASATIASGRMG